MCCALLCFAGAPGFLLHVPKTGSNSSAAGEEWKAQAFYIDLHGTLNPATGARALGELAAQVCMVT